MKDTRIYIRASRSQKTALEDAAKLAGLALSAWAMRTLLKQAAAEKLKEWNFRDMAKKRR